MEQEKETMSNVSISLVEEINIFSRKGSFLIKKGYFHAGTDNFSLPPNARPVLSHC
jgi:hypothetical protein